MFNGLHLNGLHLRNIILICSMGYEKLLFQWAIVTICRLWWWYNLLYYCHNVFLCPYVQDCDAMGVTTTGSSYFDLYDFKLISLYMLEISKSIFGNTSRAYGDSVELTILGVNIDALENTDKSSSMLIVDSFPL